MRSPRSRTGETTRRRHRRLQATGQRACAHGASRLPATMLESIAPRVAKGRQARAFPSKGNENRVSSWPRRIGRQWRLPPQREHRAGKKAHKPRGLCARVRTPAQTTWAEIAQAYISGRPICLPKVRPGRIPSASTPRRQSDDPTIAGAASAKNLRAPIVIDARRRNAAISRRATDQIPGTCGLLQRSAKKSAWLHVQPGASQGLRFSFSYGAVTSNTRLSGEGPNDGHVTTPVWLTPGFVQSQTPPGKMLIRRVISAGLNDTE